MKLIISILLALVIVGAKANSLEAEVNSQITGGNTDFKSQLFKIEHNHTFKEKYKISESSMYQYGESDNIRSLEKWNIKIRPEYLFTERTSIFLANALSANRFSGISRMYTSDVGIAHSWLKSEKFELSNSVAYRYSKEKQIDDTKISQSKGDIVILSKYKFKNLSEIKAKLTYLPNFTDSDDDNINANLDYISFLGKGFSLKIGYEWAYDEKPVAGKAKHDYTTLVGLIFKY
tara:strand:+ start:58985 stop:59683 length:699 start_codon:yes stop_codon:yes gene_type:complete